MREIVPDIFTWPWFSEPHGYDFNGYLLCHPTGNLCIDPATPSDEVLKEITRLGVSRILLTNRNHARAANRVRTATSAKTAIDPADAVHARGQGAEIDEALQIGDQIGPLEVVGVPGKSPGEIALHWRAYRILIVGDAVIGHPPGCCGLLREQVMDDPVRLHQSVRNLLDLDFDTLLVETASPFLKALKTNCGNWCRGFRTERGRYYLSSMRSLPHCVASLTVSRVTPTASSMPRTQRPL